MLPDCHGIRDPRRLRSAADVVPEVLTLVAMPDGKPVSTPHQVRGRLFPGIAP